MSPGLTITFAGRALLSLTALCVRTGCGCGSSSNATSRPPATNAPTSAPAIPPTTAVRMPPLRFGAPAPAIVAPVAAVAPDAAG